MIYRMDKLVFRKVVLQQAWLERRAPAVIEGLESFSYQRKLMGLGIVSLEKWKKQAEMLLLNFKEQDELLKSYNNSGVE